tara:strand:- start:183 stop:629 length:447 start_codon:yes stop_codon:yes gene_type:complete
MKLEIGTNFKFSKLARRINKLTNSHIQRTKTHIVNTAKRTIDMKKLQKLSDITVDNRKRGRGWGGDPVPPTSDDTPLKHTGKLYKSLKVTKEGIEGVDYALRHQFGKGVPERKFLPIIDGDKQTPEVVKFQKKLTQKLIKDMNKAMKK